jgi:hypothetical protein
MNKCFLFISFICILNASGQSFSLGDLQDYTILNITKFDAHIQKKGFRRDYNSPKENATTFSYYQRKKIKTGNALRTLVMQDKAGSKIISFQTSLPNEAFQIKEQIKRAGYKFNGSNDFKDVKPVFFQKNNFTINTSIEIRDSIPLYTFIIERKEFLKARDIIYAEDLLPLTSHEYLCYTFGENNVAKDVFYYSEKETNKCSVLFPQTPREVIFIWEDETEYRRSSFLIIGGNLKTNTSANINRPMRQNLWQSNQGVYAGMSLKELQELNESEIAFYGWHLEEAGMLTPKNTGKIDFKKLGIILGCLNCNGTNTRPAGVIYSNKALSEQRKIYVSTLIILPQQEKITTAFK